MTVVTAGERSSTVARRSAGPARWWLELGAVVVVYVAYELVRGLDHTTLATAVAHGRDILRWERRWGLSPERALNHALDGTTALAVIASYYYSTLHYVVTSVVLVWLYRCHPARYRTARTTLAVATLLALLGYHFLPTAPPRLVPGSGVMDTLARVHHWGWWGGDGSVPRGLGGLTDQYAAIPSLHVGWALWCGVLGVRYANRTWVRVIAAGYPLVTALVVLSTGNHYLLDVVSGAATVAAAAALTNRWNHLTLLHAEHLRRWA